jgi:hypothetical protein
VGRCRSARCTARPRHRSPRHHIRHISRHRSGLRRTRVRRSLVCTRRSHTDACRAQSSLALRPARRGEREPSRSERRADAGFSGLQHTIAAKRSVLTREKSNASHVVAQPRAPSANPKSADEVGQHPCHRKVRRCRALRFHRRFRRHVLRLARCSRPGCRHPAGHQRRRRRPSPRRDRSHRSRCAPNGQLA